LPQDDSQAADWYRWLAERPGLVQAKAQKRLGEMHFEGRGVPQSDVMAYQWFTRAIAGGSTSAAGFRAKLASRLSVDQFQEANKFAHEGILKDFPDDGESEFSRYLRADSYKAVSAAKFRADQGGYAWGQVNLDDALADAERRCMEAASSTDKCRWYAIGDVLVAGLPTEVIERVINDYRRSVIPAGPSRDRY
jgi:TPR repeat protein